MTKEPPTVEPVPVTIKGDKGDIGPAGAQGERGLQGLRGPAGPIGPRGRDAVVESIDYDALTAEVVKRLPPLLVNTYDRNENLIDSESYPYPGPIKIRYGYLTNE